MVSSLVTNYYIPAIEIDNPTLITPHPQGLVIQMPHGQTLVLNLGSSRSGASAMPQTPTHSKQDTNELDWGGRIAFFKVRIVSMASIYSCNVCLM